MAIRYHEYLEAGAIVAGVVVDSPQQNAAMGEKLSIPFALLSDPDRSVAIGPYGVADPKDHREIATPTTVVIDPEGNEVWRTADDPFFGRGNAVLAGGHLLIQDGFNGVLRVSRATHEGYEQVAEADLFEKGDRNDHEMWAPMALANRMLLLRSKEELICVRL